MKVSEIFTKVANQMRLDFEQARSAMSHPLFKGSAFEEALRRFLRNYLPRSLDIATGFLVDAHNNMSDQLDVIIFDAAKTPILYSSGETRVIPVECAYTVIEVKSNLESSMLYGVLKNMDSVRKLKKTAYIKSEGQIRYVDKLYGKEWEIWPINYYVFAYDSVGMQTLGNNLNRLHIEENLPEDTRIDMVCVLDKGVICNKLKEGVYNALPEPGSKLSLCETDKSLLLFYALMSRYINQARLPAFNFTAYLSEISFEKPEPKTDALSSLWETISSAGVITGFDKTTNSWTWKIPGGLSGQTVISREEALKLALSALVNQKATN